MGDTYGTVQAVIHVLSLVRAEVSLICGLADDVNAMKNELQSIVAFLTNAEKTAEGDEGAKEWVRQVIMLAYDIEDVIERYQLFRRENAFGKIMKYVNFEVPGMVATIKALREKAVGIGRARDSYRFNDPRLQGSSRNSVQTQETTSFYQCTLEEELEFVGLQGPKAELIKLLDLPRVNSRPSTTAVVGMRGLGKSTTVQSIYYDDTVRGYFPARAWIPVSQGRSHEEMLRSMMRQFTEPRRVHELNQINTIDKTSLVRLLRSHLKERRYMLVFDDVQEVDMELGAYFRRILPVNNEGSRILITTRYENVAYAWLDGSMHGMYKLNPLPSRKAWELFCTKTFKSRGGSCPSPLHDLSWDIVNKCGGLPLAIHAVGRLLSSRENDLHEWEKVSNSLGFYLKNHLTGVHKGFMQTYYDLPLYLKPCFLYFGLFPRGRPLERMKLIRLWIAEGFIREKRINLTLEEVAEEYMSQLINMSLIKVESRDSAGQIKTLGVINEFLHEIILSKLDELDFCRILSEKDLVGNEKARRLSIHWNHKPDTHEILGNITKSKSNIRSLLLINVPPKTAHKVASKAFFKSVRLLKILDLSDAPIETIPSEVGRLFNLNYLSLRNTRVRVLPSSIGNLQDLQTLDLKQTLVSELPKELDQLHQLRHLLAYYYESDFAFSAHSLKLKGVKIPERVLGQFPELQKLAFLDVGVVQRSWVAQLRNLIQLRKLGIVGLKQEDGKDLCSVIDGMKCLQTLSIFSKDKSEDLDLAHLSSRHENLKRLYLNGPLVSFPRWTSGLHSLIKIRLRWSNLHADPLESLQELPNLVELQLLEAYVGEHLQFRSRGFQKLKILHLLDLRSLKALSISKGCMPLLEELSIGESGNLEVPSGIQYLSNLKTLQFYDMPERFTDRILPGTEYYSIVQHVPDVFFHSNRTEGNWETYTLR